MWTAPLWQPREKGVEEGNDFCPLALTLTSKSVYPVVVTFATDMEVNFFGILMYTEDQQLSRPSVPD